MGEGKLCKRGWGFNLLIGEVGENSQAGFLEGQAGIVRQNPHLR